MNTRSVNQSFPLLVLFVLVAPIVAIIQDSATAPRITKITAAVDASPTPNPSVATFGSISVNGHTRRYVYAVSGYAAPASGRPLVIHLHGDGGNMGLSAAWKAAVLNDANGAVLLSAQGRNNIPAAAAIDGSAWRFRMDEAGQPYDCLLYTSDAADE